MKTTYLPLPTSPTTAVSEPLLSFSIALRSVEPYNAKKQTDDDDKPFDRERQIAERHRKLRHIDFLHTERVAIAYEFVMC